MKRLLIALLAICILVSLGIVPASAEGNKIQLSSLSETECRQFLLEHGVAIPEELEDISVKDLFAAIEADPDHKLIFSWTVASNFCDTVYAVVKEYYGISTTPSIATSNRTTSAQLQYSQLYEWDENTMPRYNCYAFAIGLTNSSYNPGSFSGGTYVHTHSVSQVAQVVKADLQEGLGYSCVKVTSSRPSSTAGWENVIALRKDTTYDAIINDYHFAKLTADGWLHKPGGTAVLKFNNAPTNAVAWILEGYEYGAYFTSAVTYDSDIVYFSYKTTHNITTKTWTGQHYHSGMMHFYEYTLVCTSCGMDISDTEWVAKPCSGPPCSIFQPNKIVEQDGAVVA